MDIVFIRGLEIRVIIGANDWERQVKQNVIINLEMKADVTGPALHDDLAQAVNYSEVVTAVERFVSRTSFRLVETLAEAIARLVITEFGVTWLRLEVIKPRPLSGRHVVGVVIERGMPDIAIADPDTSRKNTTARQSDP